MKCNARIISLVFLFVPVLFLNCTNTHQKDEIDLWPDTEPFKTGYLKVSDIHEIYYELCGNPDGKPVFVLHGGPGAGCYPYYRRFCDPEKFLIVLHDQRGCGRSKPPAEIRENTTQNLVEDIESLRKFLELDKIILFGGSWGTTLGLAYGEAYPENVTGMVLRGVFTATKEELDHYYYGGVGNFFPEVYNELVAAILEKGEKISPQTLFELIYSGDRSQKKRYSVAWLKYEAMISKLEATEDHIEMLWAKSDTLKQMILNLGLLENYYMANGCFLEEGQLLNNADRIVDIPIIIVNGRYDMICPPINAYRLHKKLPMSKLIIAEMAGHSMSQKPIEKALLKAMTEFE